jgi:hypothetical protein
MKAKADGVLKKALSQSQSLSAAVAIGKQAIEGKDRHYFVESDRNIAYITDSIALDTFYKKDTDRGRERRWDYLIGVCGEQRTWVVPVEVHPAHEGEVRVMIEKAEAARSVLKKECGQNPVGEKQLWYWVATGSVSCSRTGSASRRLAEKGIAFPRSQLSIPIDLTR